MTFDDTAFVLMNMQRFFLDLVPERKRKELISGQKRALDYCRKNEIPLYVVSNLFDGMIVNELAPDLEQFNCYGCDVTYLDNDLSNAFIVPEFVYDIEKKDLSQLCFMGIGCGDNDPVYETAGDAVKRGYTVSTASPLIYRAFGANTGIFCDYTSKTKELFRNQGKLYESLDELFNDKIR
ncbi:MAG: hypothetical protein ACLFPQ_06625 [Candidatus Woesearchaeota archaeon]